MSCKQIRPLLPELAGGELGPGQRLRTEEHLRGCAGCRTQYEGLAEAIGMLRRAGQEDAAPPGFGAQLHLRLSREPPPRRPAGARLVAALGQFLPGRRVRWGLALSGAALLALLLAYPGGLPRGSAPDGPAPFQVPSRRVAVVNFNFVTNVVVDHVAFEVTLPQELTFIHEGKPIAPRTLRWTGALSAGANQIPLAVSGAKPGRYKIVAHARGEGVDVQHDVLLEVVSS